MSDLHVVVADDDLTIGDLMARMISRFLPEAEVRIAENPKQADQYVRELRAERKKVVLVSDIDMPDETAGLKMVDRLIENGNIFSSQVIMMSGNPDHAEGAEKRGLVFLGKPFTVASMIEAIKKAALASQ